MYMINFFWRIHNFSSENIEKNNFNIVYMELALSKAEKIIEIWLFAKAHMYIW